jgi:hypothetical protein
MPTVTKKALKARTGLVESNSVDVLALAVLRALEAGNGRSNRCEVTDELPHDYVRTALFTGLKT